MNQTVSKFSTKEIKIYLNEFGKCLFGLTNDTISKFHSKNIHQVYTGEIGNENVIMVLNLNGIEFVEGEYVYQKYGHGIFIDGKKVNDWFEMDEYDSSGTKSGKIEATLKDMEIKGSWSNTDNTKTYPFFVKRK
jgi:hypothetical protein